MRLSLFQSLNKNSKFQKNLDPSFPPEKFFRASETTSGEFLRKQQTGLEVADSKKQLGRDKIEKKHLFGFEKTKNAEGLKTAQAFIIELKTPYTGTVNTGKPSFMDFVGSLGSVLLQFLPF